MDAAGTFLRVVALAGLLLITCFVFSLHRSPVALALTGVATVAAALIEYKYEAWLMEEGRQLFRESA